jgi:predicted ester cyclase
MTGKSVTCTWSTRPTAISALFNDRLPCERNGTSDSSVLEWLIDVGADWGTTAKLIAVELATGTRGWRRSGGLTAFRRWDAVAMSGRSAREVVEELLRRQQASESPVLDDLVAEDMVNHAAGLQGRSGLAQILSTIDHDLGPVTVEQHHLVGDGDMVAQHLTLHGAHRASTMPLLADVIPSGRPAAWTFIHMWRVADGMIVEHWACRDDMGLLDQLRD